MSFPFNRVLFYLNFNFVFLIFLLIFAVVLRYAAAVYWTHASDRRKLERRRTIPATCFTRDDRIFLGMYYDILWFNF